MPDVKFATLSGGHAVVSQASVEGFREALHGLSLLPGDAGYDRVRRVWNAMVDKRPALIARCSGTADVINSVNFARENGLLISVRGGGHNFPGNSVCDDGLMIDLSLMTGVRVDPANRTARAQGGTKWGAFDHETQAFGLAAPGGTDPDTGIAGLTLGGGIGWLSGSHGLSCDNLISADVVTSDGRMLTASADENSDLLWGLRGGGGNFGVVTSFEYRLHPVGPTVLAGYLVYPYRKAREWFARLEEFTAGMPDAMNIVAFLATLPEGGEKVCRVLLCYYGPIEEGERVMRPLRELGPPLSDEVRPMTYAEAQALALAAPGRRNYLKSHFLSQVSAAVADINLDFFDRATSPLSGVLFQYLGNAARRLPATATAFGQRGALCQWAANAVFLDPGESEIHVRWVREFASALSPFSSGPYVNHVNAGSAEGAADMQAGFGVNFERLAALQRRYDPANLFSPDYNRRPGVHGPEAGRVPVS
ncbi:MAG: FAD-binding oxidoreductase [Chloroflexi bacterium]|nr:FAD-binding oxidoreductase [Chloroflexota bacterium]MYE41685.1 FAD-binding oxidoreductase [Chloroflexota bacterium]